MDLEQLCRNAGLEFDQETQQAWGGGRRAQRYFIKQSQRASEAEALKALANHQAAPPSKELAPGVIAVGWVGHDSSGQLVGPQAFCHLLIRIARAEEKGWPSLHELLEQQRLADELAADDSPASVRALELLATLKGGPSEEWFIHGNLRSEHVLCDGEGRMWSISPLGAIGDRAWDLATFIAQSSRPSDELKLQTRQQILPERLGPWLWVCLARERARKLKLGEPCYGQERLLAELDI